MKPNCYFLSFIVFGIFSLGLFHSCKDDDTEAVILKYANRHFAREMCNYLKRRALNEQSLLEYYNEYSVKYKLCYHVTRRSSTVIIKDSMSSFNYNALYYDPLFLWKPVLSEVRLPNYIKTIDDNAFSYSDLVSIDLNDSISTIGREAFCHCVKLKEIEIPNAVSSIGAKAFYGCESLVSVTLPETITSIEDSTFFGCISIEQIIIPNSVTTIGKDVFSYCKSCVSGKSSGRFI